MIQMTEVGMAEKIAVLLVDDHALVRRGFRRLLEDETDIDVRGEASDGEEAVQLAKTLRPDVVVMDCALPGVNGLNATRRILEENNRNARRVTDAEHFALPKTPGVRQATGSRSAGLRAEERSSIWNWCNKTAIRRVATGESSWIRKDRPHWPRFEGRARNRA